MVVAQFLEIQRQMLPGHLSLHTTQTKTLVSALLCALIVSQAAFAFSLKGVDVVPQNVSLLSLKCCSRSMCHQHPLGLNKL